MNYWLIKSEPSEFSIDDLRRAPSRTAHWDGVRNYQRAACSALPFKRMKQQG